MEKKVFELDFGGRKIFVEVGELAKQANVTKKTIYSYKNGYFF